MNRVCPFCPSCPPLQDTCSLHPLGATSSAERFLEALNLLSSPPAAAAEQQQGCPDSSSSSSRPFDLGSLIAAVQPLQQQQQGQLLQAPSRSAAAQQVHGGVLMPLSGNANSTSSSSAEPQQHLLRVVLVYCRSRLPAPVWVSHRHGPGLAVDCLHVHDKPQPGEQQQQLQVGSMVLLWHLSRVATTCTSDDVHGCSQACTQRAPHDGSASACSVPWHGRFLHMRAYV